MSLLFFFSCSQNLCFHTSPPVRCKIGSELFFCFFQLVFRYENQKLKKLVQKCYATLKSSFQDTLNFSHSSLPQAATLTVHMDLRNTDRQDQTAQRSICPNDSCSSYLRMFFFISLTAKFHSCFYLSSILRLLSCCAMCYMAHMDVCF